MKEAVVQSSMADSATAKSAVENDNRVNVFVYDRESNTGTWGPAALEQRRERTRDHLAKIAGRRESWISRNSYYYGLLNRLFRFLVEPEKKVLSIRCDTGNLLGVV